MKPFRRQDERGVAAVEFALVLLPLMLILFGIIQYGRGYQAKVEITGGVREGARALALGKTAAQAKAAVVLAAPGLSPALSTGNISTTACPAGGAEGNATVTATYTLPAIALMPALPMTVTGVMRCGL